MNLKISHKKTKYFGFILLGLLLFSYWPIIIKNPILNYDDHSLIDPLQSIHQLKDYFWALKNGIISDLQPIRDFSYFLDFFLENQISFLNAHTLQFLLWPILLYQWFKIFNRTLADKKLVIIFIFMLAFFPLFSTSVAWLSARKHLLSALFSTMLLNYFLDLKNGDNYKLKEKWVMWTLYLLSAFSHPINALVSFFILGKLFFDKKLKKEFTFAFVLILLSAFVLGLNYFYYRVIYPQFNFNLSKLVISNDSKMSFALLGLGRYFYLSINPFDALPTSHYIGSVQNMVGLILLPLFFWGSFRFLKAKNPKVLKNEYPLSWLLFLLPLFIVLISPTNIFCSDTYLLNSTFAIWLIFALVLEQFLSKQFIYITLILFTSILFFYNLNYIKHFSNDESLFRYAYQKEATPFSISVLANIEVEKNNLETSRLLVDQLEKWDSNNPFICRLKSKNVYYDKSLSSVEKLNKLNNLIPSCPTKNLYLAALHAREMNSHFFMQHFSFIFSDKNQTNLELSQSIVDILAFGQNFCERIKSADCKTEIEKHKIFFIKSSNLTRFNQTLTFFQKQKNLDIELRL
jgi:hypothetical protein